MGFVPADQAGESRCVVLPVCRKCRSQNVRRSRVRYYDWPLLLFFVPLRCRSRKCQARFYALRYGRVL